MRSLHEIAADMKDFAEMLLQSAKEIEEVGNLFAGISGTKEVKPAKASPFLQVEKRKLSKQEKEQIRLLWSQRNPKTKEESKFFKRDLAQTYKTSVAAINGVVVNNVSKINGTKTQKSVSVNS